MKLHIIIDFMHIYYKYYFQNKSGRIKKLSSVVAWNGTTIEKDTTLIYYPLRDIEGIRKQLEGNGHDVYITVCIDSKTKRKDENSEYKSNRHNELSDTNIDEINYIEKTLRNARYTVLKEDGYEADDIVNNLVKKYKNKFDYTIIYTNDKDLLTNIDDKVSVLRFKQMKGYTQVEKSNYSKYLEDENGVYIPYNALGLYLSAVGDNADGIKGIKGFGKAAFKKYIARLSQEHDINWSKCGDYNELSKVVELSKDILTEEQFNQLKESFKLVSSMKLDIGDIEFTKSTEESRLKAYKELNMISLVH